MITIHIWDELKARIQVRIILSFKVLEQPRWAQYMHVSVAIAILSAL